MQKKQPEPVKNNNGFDGPGPVSGPIATHCLLGAMVRLGIKYKLFAILLSASILIIAAMFVFTRISFERGLIAYMDKVQWQNLQAMGRILEDNYAQDGSWQFLRDNPDIWRSFQRYSFRKTRHTVRKPPWLDRVKGPGLLPEKTRDGEFGLNHGPQKTRHHPQFILLDRDKKPVIDKSTGELPERLMPLRADGNLVGFLGIRHPGSVIQEEELRFFKRQTRMLVLIALSMTIIAVIVAVWTAYFLERPIKTLTRGTRSLASGDYKTRIPVGARDELGQLSEDFNTLAGTLEKSEADRKKWVEDIAHELRTPLTLLSGELEAVEDGVRELTSDTIARLQGDIRHLIRLVTDLNELSRTDKGAMEYRMRSVDPGILLDDAVNRFSEACDEQGLSLDYSAHDTAKARIHADPERLNQLLGNIIQNSLDYTREGGRLRIRTSVDSKTFRLVFEDTAPGVPDEALPRLFDRLYRVEGSRNRRYGGSGLGLSICRNIAHAHGGTISADHSPLGGLALCVVLPRSDSKNG